MPHQRKRLILPVLQKRLRLFPVVGLLGARQTGKSTILREILAATNKIKYVTLDREEVKKRAEEQPTLFLASLEQPGINTVCIDEVQKAPVLFDTIKAEVDERKRPGRFCISGSTEFSKKTGINEALTGRIGLLRLYPINVSEALEQTSSYPLVEMNFKKNNSITLKNIQQWHQRGGMPGFFAVRDSSSRESFFENWLETTCSRDLSQFKIPKFDPDLARRIYVSICKIDHATAYSVAASVGKNPRQIEKYIEAFKALFVIYEIPKHVKGVGKPHLYPLDAGIAKYLGASEHLCMQIWFLNELYSQFSYSGIMRPDVFHYETSRGSRVDFVIEHKDMEYAVQLTGHEAPGTYHLRAIRAFSLKFKDMKCFVLSPCNDAHKISEQIRIIPWNFVV